MSVLERVKALLTAAVLGLPRPLRRLIAGRPLRRDGLELELDIQVLIRLLALEPHPALGIAPPPQAREHMLSAVRVCAGRPVAVERVEDLDVAGGAGPIRGRLIVPADAGAGLLVYLHGGGWVVGDLDSHEPFLRQLAAHSGVRVLAVDYRRAPEHPHPAPGEDAHAAWRSALARAESLGADPACVAVGGDSAGGQLAAVTCLRARQAGEPQPALQLLVYPATDLAVHHPSRERFGRGLLLEADTMAWYEAQLTSGPTPVDRRDPLLSPLHAPDLSGLAPAHVVTAGFDPLRDEGEAYARRLAEAGVPTVLRRHAGMPHGFASVAGVVPAAGRAVAEMGGALRAALSR